jgi:uncharacterized lipoprotein YmbA
MLAAIPEDIRQRLCDALVSLDSERITAAIDEAAKTDATLAHTLRRFAESFDYPAILRALEAKDS